MVYINSCNCSLRNRKVGAYGSCMMFPMGGRVNRERQEQCASWRASLLSFINAYVGELITEEMAADRDFKYLAILDHKSHLSTSNANKRKPSATSSHTAQKRSQSMSSIPLCAFIVRFASILEATPIALKNSICPFSEDHCEDDYDDQDEGGDEDEDSCFILDAKDYGSISRFYNHSCRPNVNIQNVKAP